MEVDWRRRKKRGECVPVMSQIENGHCQCAHDDERCHAGLEDLEIEVIEAISGHLPHAVDQYSLWATCRRTFAARHPTRLTITDEKGNVHILAPYSRR